MFLACLEHLLADVRISGRIEFRERVPWSAREWEHYAEWIVLLDPGINLASSRILGKVDTVVEDVDRLTARPAC